LSSSQHVLPSTLSQPFPAPSNQASLAASTNRVESNASGDYTSGLLPPAEVHSHASSRDLEDLTNAFAYEEDQTDREMSVSNAEDAEDEAMSED
jgi:hypothetical protein